MPQQNDAAAFDADFAEAYTAAENNAAVDFGEQFAADTGTPPKQEPGLVDRVDAALTPNADAGVVAKGAMGATRDVTLGVMQAPRSAARGVVKGVNGIINFVDGAMDYMPTVGILDDKGELGLPRITTRGTAKDRLELQAANNGLPKPELTPQLPEPDAPKVPTVTGGIIEAATQFAVGFKGVDKLAKMGAMGQTLKTYLANPGMIPAAVKGAMGDLLAFDEHEARLSNLIQQVPALQNPVTEYLQAKPDDGFAEGKFKQGLEGLGLGLATDLVFKGVRLLKGGLAAKEQAKAAGENIDDLFAPPKEEAAGLGLGAKDFEFLGDAADENLLRRQAKQAAAEGEVQGAFGKTKQVPETPSASIDDYEINFSRIEGPDDIKKLMDEMVNKPELKASIEAERRGERSNTTTLAAAEDIDGFEALLNRRTGDAFNAEHIVAGRKVYYDTTTKLMEAAKRAASPTASDIDQFNFRKMVALHHAIQKEFMGIRAEAGRALQAWSIPVGGTGAENVRALETVLRDYGGAEASKDLATRMVALGEKLNTSQINAITQKAAAARTVDAVAEAWTLGLLTNPTTHVVNMSSNVLTGLQLGAERLAMAGMEGSPVTIREGQAFFTAMLESQRMAIKNMAQAFRTGETGFGVGKIDLPPQRNTARDILDPEGKAGIFSKAIDGWGALLSKYAGGALAAGDEYSKTVLYNAQLRALATREGIAKGLDGTALKQHVADALASPPATMRADAVTFAQYGTFTKQLGEGGAAVQKLIAKQPLLRFVAPFVRTPANIFKFSFERTPLGFLSQNIRDDIAAGGLRRATALSKIGMGTSVMAMGADMALQGKMTGAGPADPKTRAALRRTGWQPYSIKMGDTWYSYARFEPVATLLGMSADIGEIISNYEVYDVQAQAETDKMVTAAVIAVGNQLVGKTFMRGFADLTEMLSDPQRYAAGFLQRFAGSFVPAGSAALERAGDPAQEQVFNMLDAMRSRIPGASEFVPKRRNVWGEEIKYFYPNDENIAASAAERVTSLFNPVYRSAEQDAPLDRWMLKNGFSVEMPDKVQAFDGVRIDLREYPEIYSRLVELRGNGVKLQKYGNQGMKDFFTNLATEKDPFGRHVGFFMAIGNNFDDQQNFISQASREYNDAAKEQVLQEYPDLAGVIGRERRNAAAINAVRPPAKVSGGTQ